MSISHFFYKTKNAVLSIASYLISQCIGRYVYCGQKPMFASFEISSTCNLHCPQCMIGTNRVNRSNTKLDIELYRLIINTMRKYLTNAILYFQGEPMMNKQFIDYVNIGKQAGIYCMTSTNGLLIDRLLAKQIVESGLDKIIVSIDGTTQNTYGKYRVGGKIEKAVNAIRLIDDAKRRLHKSSPIIVAQMIVFSHNEHEVEDFKKQSLLWGADIYSIKSAQIYDIDNNIHLLPANSRYSRYTLRNGAYTTKHRIGACFRAWSGVVITADGYVVPCCFDKEAQHQYTHLDTNNVYHEIDLLTKSKSYTAFHNILLRHRSSITMCNNCNER